MKNGKMNTQALWLLICLGVLPLMNQTSELHAQEITTGLEPTSRILFIFDASNSMSGQWDGARKIDMAREVLFEMLDSLEQLAHVEMALRVYGHQSPVPPPGLQRYQAGGAFWTF